MEIQNRYAVLQEFNDPECECWLYFIKYNGNQDALKILQKQIDSIDGCILDGYSSFDLDTEHLVSEQTAKEMTKIELNHYQWNRKFDGKLSKIDFKFKHKDENDDKIIKVNEILSYGQIENFIDGEDIDPEDLTDATDTEDDEETNAEDIINDIFSTS